MIDRIIRGLWHDMPAHIGRYSRILGVALSDGSYLAVWRSAAIAIPIASFIAGCGLALLQKGTTFSYSLLGLALFAAIAGIGAGAGCYALLGYVIVDIVKGNPLGGLPRPDALTLFQIFSAAAISYALLAMLLVLVPIAAVGLREETTRLLRVGRPWFRQSVHALLAGGLIWAWCQATAFLLRPVWSFRGRSPDIDAIQPLQIQTWVVVLAGVLTVVSRTFVEMIAARNPPRWMEEPTLDPRFHPRLPPVIVTVPLRAVLLLVLLAGLVGSVLEAVLLFVALLVPLFIQARIGRYKLVRAVTSRVPVLARIIVVVVAAYLIATVVVEPWARSTTSFVPMLISVTLSLFVAAFLLPHPE